MQKILNYFFSTLNYFFNLNKLFNIEIIDIIQLKITQRGWIMEVKYHNNLNNVSLRKFTASELDLFMVLCHKMYNQNMKKVVYTFEELRELTNFSSTDMKDFVDVLDTTYNKLIQTNIRIGDNVKWTRFVLFTEYTVDTEEKIVTIQVNEKFQWVLNQLTQNFTIFELEQFLDLRSSYSKECYRRLKRFRDTGFWIVKIDEFRRLLDIPESYRMCDIDQKVLKPIKTELKQYFSNFKVEKIKKGRRIDKLKFVFDPNFISENSGIKRKKTNFFERNKEIISQNKKSIIKNGETDEEFISKLLKREKEKNQ